MSSETVQYRKADQEDAEELLKLQYLCYQSEAELYGHDIQPLTQKLASVREEILKGPSFVALLDGLVVGGVRCRIEDGVMTLGKLITHPRARRRGIASRLMECAEEAARNAGGVTAIQLFTGARSDGNLLFYGRRGYAITHTAEGMTWMQKTLG